MINNLSFSSEFKIVIILSLFWVSTAGLSSQVNDIKILPKPIQQLNLLESEVKDNLINNILPFWVNNMVDDGNSGFYGRMGGNNKIVTDAIKGGILNARILWTFSRAFRILKDSSYLKIATRAKDYILDNFIDKQYGGAYYSLKFTGKPEDIRKQVYTQSFFIYSLSEYYRATGDKTALCEAKKIFRLVEKQCLDKKNNGYFEVYSQDWKRISDKMIGEKTGNDTKGMNTHIHLLEAYTNLYRAWPSGRVERSLRNLIEILMGKLVDNKSNHLIIFTDDKWTSTTTLHSYGHDIEASWLIVEAALELGDNSLIDRVKETSKKMAVAAFEGLQSDGSIIYEKDYITGELNTSRQWWPQAETVVGSLNMYDLTGDTKYLDIAINCWEFIKNNLIDHENGEWWGSVSATGSRGRGDKAGFWKCPYHNSRMCLAVIIKNSSIK